MASRLALRPGALLLRRDATHLQVGTSPGIVIADRPGLMALLRLLDGVRDLGRLQDLADVTIPELTTPVADVLVELRAVGAVVDAAATTGIAVRRAVARIAFDVQPGADSLAATTRTLLTAVGVNQQPSSEPDLLLIVSAGETSRTIYERASLLGIDHLPVVIDEDRVRIGPLVRPGRTPCVGCHDLHRTDWDAAWPALVLQLGRGPIRSSALHPLTEHAAAVEVVAEVVAHADGGAPRTAGRCLVIGPSHDQRATWPIAFHPRCACDLLSAA
jgi:hypothetical protein